MTVMIGALLSIGKITAMWYTKLKGTTALVITMFYIKDLNKPLILIPVLSKLVQKCGSFGCLNICKWTVMEAAIL